MRQYVCGFLFDKLPFQVSRVLLTRKEFPAWQQSFLNGAGGKIEPGENPTEAMQREAFEELGLTTPEWRQFAVERHPEYEVHFFRATAPEGFVASARNDVGETLSWHVVPLGYDQSLCPIGNLRWLIPLALDWRDLGLVQVFTRDNISERPTW